MKVRATGSTDIGLKRKLNEDSFLVLPALGLCVIADGMGGHKAGEVASRMVVETMADYWQKVRSNRPPSFLVPVNKSICANANHLINSILLSNLIIHEAQKKPEYHRMGSTVSALLVEDDCIWIANVGDSPIYHFNGGRLVLISEEHSVEAERRSMRRDGKDPLESTNPMLKNVLTRVLGLNKTVDVFIRSIRPEAGDMLMTCSDGLTNYVSEPSIAAVLDDFSIPCERKVNLLIQEANRAGGKDNITVILVEILEEGKWRRWKRKFLVSR